MKGIFDESKNVYRVNNPDGTFETYTPAQYRELNIEAEVAIEEEKVDVVIDATNGQSTPITEPTVTTGTPITEPTVTTGTPITEPTVTTGTPVTEPNITNTPNTQI